MNSGGYHTVFLAHKLILGGETFINTLLTGLVALVIDIALSSASGPGLGTRL